MYIITIVLGLVGLLACFFGDCSLLSSLLPWRWSLCAPCRDRVLPRTPLLELGTSGVSSSLDDAVWKQCRPKK